jgi:hypothetical protein
MIQPRFNPGVAVLIPGCPYHQFLGSFPSRFQFLLLISVISVNQW